MKNGHYPSIVPLLVSSPDAAPIGYYSSVFIIWYASTIQVNIIW